MWELASIRPCVSSSLGRETFSQNAYVTPSSGQQQVHRTDFVIKGNRYKQITCSGECSLPPSSPPLSAVLPSAKVKPPLSCRGSLPAAAGPRAACGSQRRPGRAVSEPTRPPRASRSTCVCGWPCAGSAAAAACPMAHEGPQCPAWQTEAAPHTPRSSSALGTGAPGGRAG